MDPGATLTLKLTGSPGLPKEFSLKQNYPNPFNPLTVIRYELPVRSRVTLNVYSILGQIVRTMVDEVQDAGYQSRSFDANSLASGVYFYEINATAVNNPQHSINSVRKMVLLR
jgi:hypothetical protein